MTATQKQIAKIKSLWKQHRNIWEISQLVGLTTEVVSEIALGDTPSAISQAAAAMGRAKSPAKKAAAIENGKKGGRPKKGCTCHLKSKVTGPVPHCCPLHDGDYSSWLAANNCD